MGSRPRRWIACDKDERAAGVDGLDEEGRHVALAKRDDVADRQRLELGHDRIDGLDVAPGEVLQPVVAVETAATLAQLEQPGPDRLRRRRDRDAARMPDVRLRDEIVAGERPVQVVRTSPPAAHRGREPACPGDGQGHGGAEERNGNKADAHGHTSARERQVASTPS